MVAAKKNLKLSVKPSIQGSEVPRAESWVESRNGSDSEIEISEVQAEPLTSSAPERFKRITFEVSEQQHQRAKIYAVQKGISIKDLMIELLERELNNGT